ncbi:MAG TPA: tetratricopeptide repeat protein, partial [Pyrinomonadaceae bacterium]
MRFLRGCLAALLVASSWLAGAGAPAGSARRADARDRGSEEKAAGGSASDEREQGRGLLRRGRAAEALVHLERALKAFQQSGDREGEASADDLLGELYERQGRYDLALRHYLAAKDLYVAAASAGKPAAPPAGKAPAEAAQAARAAGALAPGESVYNARLMLAKIGQMLYRRGDLAGARTAYARMNVKRPDTSALGKAKRAKGILGAIGASVGSDNRGVRIGAPAVGGLIAVKDQLDFYRQSILYASNELGLGRIDYREGKFEQAREHFENVLEATDGDLPGLGKLGQTRRYRAAARTSLGDVALKEGRLKDAAEAYEKALKGARDDKRQDLMWPAQLGTGRSLWRQAAAEKDGKKADRLRAEALDSYRGALDTVERIRQGSVRADESRTTFLAAAGEVFEEAAAALAETAIAAQSGIAPAADAAPQAGAPLEGRALAVASEALAAVERGRARSLLDMLGEAGAEVASDVPAELLRERRENRARQDEIASLLTGVALGGEAKKKSLEDLEEELDDLQAKFEGIENRIRAASPRYEALTAARPLALEEVRARVLDDETALLEYSLGEPRSYLFAVTRGGFSVSRLPGREEIGRQAADFRQQAVPASARRPLTDLVAAAVDPQRGLKVGAAQAAADPAAVRAYADAALALYRTAVGPAAPLFKASRLLVVADGVLNYVPFDALLSAPPAEGADYSALPYLLKTNETVFAPSASVVAGLRRQRESAAAPTGGVLVVADPVFDASDSRAGAPRQAGADSGR